MLDDTEEAFISRQSN